MRKSALAILMIVTGAAHAGSGVFPEFESLNLKQGRTIWLGTCAACHANVLGDAPQFKDKSAWTPRVAKGREALYASALKGYSSTPDTEMPPRGGNTALSDADVRAAVDYMIELVTR